MADTFVTVKTSGGGSYTYNKRTGVESSAPSSTPSNNTPSNPSFKYTKAGRYQAQQQSVQSQPSQPTVEQPKPVSQPVQSPQPNISLASGGVGYAAPSGQITPLTPIGNSINGGLLYSSSPPQSKQLPSNLFTKTPFQPVKYPVVSNPVTPEQVQQKIFQKAAEPASFQRTASLVGLRLQKEVVSMSAGEVILSAFTAPIFSYGTGVGQLGQKVLGKVGLRVSEEFVPNVLGKGIGSLIAYQGIRNVPIEAAQGEPVESIATGFGLRAALAAPFFASKESLITEVPARPPENPSFKNVRVPRVEEPLLRPYTIKPEGFKPESDIPLSIQRFRERLVEEAKPTNEGGLIEVGVGRMASSQQIQQALKSLVILQRPIIATEEEGLASSVFSRAFQQTLKRRGSRALLVEPTEQFAPRSPITEQIITRRVAPIIIPATLTLPLLLRGLKNDLSFKFNLGQLNLQNQLTLPKLELLPLVRTESLQIPAILSITSTASLQRTSYGTLPIQTFKFPEVIPPILTGAFSLGEFPGRASKLSGWWKNIAKYTPNIRGVEAGVRASRTTGLFTGLEVRGVAKSYGIKLSKGRRR